jgi:hypothetical protein
MSQRCVESVLGRLITDSDFRVHFFDQPEAVCSQHQLDLTPNELSALLKIDTAELETTAAGLDPRIVRAVIQPPEGRTGAAMLQPARGRKSGS